MICRDCGKEFFDEEHPRRRLCEDCRREHRRAIDKRWTQLRITDPVCRERRRQVRQKSYQKHKEKHLDYCKKYRQENTEKMRGYWRERYRQLSPDDKRRILLNSKLRKAVANDEHKPFCQWCGRDFKPKYKGEKYCSEECYSHSPLRRMYKENQKALKFLIDIFFKDGRLT